MKNALSLACMFLAGILLSTSSFAQSNTLFNPDYNGDGFIGVDDILGALSFYDNAWEGPVSPSWSCGDPIGYAGVDYSTVQIGDQCWFAENLRTSTFLNGDTIPQNLSDGDWSSTTSGAMAFYNNGPPFSGLYNWFAVDDVRGLCPSSWHVPTDAEWTILTDHLGGESVAGVQMKTTYGWLDGGNGTNSSGFSGLPGGYRFNSGVFNAAGSGGYWWSSSPISSGAWVRYLSSNDENVLRYYSSVPDGFSVRCVRDAEGVVCTSDADSDGICDDVDPCVGSLDACGVCNGPGAIYDCGCSGIPVGDCDCDGNQLDALGVCGGSCSADADGDGICDDVDPAQFPCGNMISYQGYEYATVQIGDQCWFAENLRSENYENGEAIPSDLSDSEWSSTTSGAVSVYGEDAGCDGFSPDIDACDPAQSLNEYGRLYNWYAVDDARGLCPTGWHVPTDGEWTVLTDHLGGASVAGEHMKTSYGWNAGGNGTNSSGFSGLPGGNRFNDGNFLDAGINTLWWSSSPSGSTGWVRYLFNTTTEAHRGAIGPQDGFSVRCVRNAEGVVCTSDADSDGICDDLDPCVGSLDACGVCNGPGAIYDCGCSGIPVGDCDCDGNQLDALGVCGGSCTMDANGDGICDDVDPSLFQCGNVMTYQGYNYATVLIGEQCWFAENLRSESYENGDAIPAGLSDSEWGSTISGAVAVYGEGSSTCINSSPDGDACDEAWSLNEYGRLYNWYAVDDARGLCPSGWHVPTDGEWTVLTDHLGGASVAGVHMKTSYGWNAGGNGTNSSGFSGLPGGNRFNNGNFFDAGNNTLWWSSSPSGSTGWVRYLFNTTTEAHRAAIGPQDGFSVRCVRNPGGVVCTSDADSDGICDDVDPCEGSLDACGVCNGPGAIYDCGCSGIPVSDCDCDGNQLDALGVCGGSCTMDANGNGICDDVDPEIDPSLFQCGNVMTYQGYNYATVLIGEQCWFAENLRSESYKNGDAIPAGLSDSEWGSTISGAVAVYGEGSSTCFNSSPDGDACDEAWSLNEYGRLYNWYAVDDARRLCPSGWHVPTDGEWTVLTDHLGGASVAGVHMKTSYGWNALFNEADANGTNSSGFSGLPGGYRSGNGWFDGAGRFGNWWSSSPSWMRSLTVSSGTVYRDPSNQRDGLYVRCVRNPGGVVCTSDADGDGICDDVDPCVGALDACGVCNGPGEIYECGCSGIPVGDCDCYGNQLDAIGVCGGSCLSDPDGDGICGESDPAQFECGNVRPYQGYDYATVLIGDQCWFAENLRTTTYLNGEAIPQNLSEWDWYSTNSGAMAFYNNGNDPAYGGLYNWYAVGDARGLCPSGWHVPTDGEWTILTDHLGGESFAGIQMKTTYGWLYDGNGTNSSGFSGLPGGYREPLGYFHDAGYGGYWWSSSPYVSNAWTRSLNYTNENVFRSYYNPHYGFSVRCVRDAE